MKPDWRDVHVYGGLLLAASGAAMLDPGIAALLGGAALFYLGVWRMG